MHQLATLSTGDSSSTILLQGTDNLRMGGGDNDVTVTAGAHADIQGGSGHSTFVLSGDASLTVHGHDTVTVLAMDATVFDQSTSLHVQVAGALNLVGTGGSATLSGYAGTATVDASASEGAVVASSSSLLVTTAATGDGSVVDMGAAGTGTTGTVVAMGHDTITGGKGTMDIHASIARSVTTRKGAMDTLVVGGQGTLMDLQGHDTLDALVSDAHISSGGILQAVSHGTGNRWNLSGQSNLALEGADHLAVLSGAACVSALVATSMEVSGGRLDYTGLVSSALVTGGILHAIVPNMQEFILSGDGGSLDADGFRLAGSHSVLRMLHGAADIDATASNGGSILLDAHAVVMGGRGTSVVSGAGGVTLTTAGEGTTVLDLALQDAASSSTVVARNDVTVQGGAGALSIVGSLVDEHSVVLDMADGEDAALSTASLLSTKVVLNRGMGSSCLDVGDEREGGLSLAFGAGVLSSDVRFTRSTDGLMVTLLDGQGNPTGDRLLLKGASPAAPVPSLGTLSFGDGTTSIFSPAMIVSDVPATGIVIHVVVKDCAGSTVPLLLSVSIDGAVVSTTQITSAPGDAQDVVLNGLNPSTPHQIGLELGNAPDGAKVEVSFGKATPFVPVGSLVVEAGHPSTLPLFPIPQFDIQGVAYSPQAMMGPNTGMGLKMFSMQPLDEMLAAKFSVAALLEDSGQLSADEFSDYPRFNQYVIGELLVRSQLGVSLGIQYDPSSRALGYGGSREDIVDAMLGMGAGIDDLQHKSAFWTSAVAVLDYLDNVMFSQADMAASMPMDEMVRIGGLGGYLEALRKPLTLAAGQYLETRGGSLSIDYSIGGNVVSVGNGDYIAVGGDGNDLFRPGHGHSVIDLGGGDNSLTEDVNYTISTIDMRGQDDVGHGLATLGDGSTTTFKNVQNVTSARGGNVIMGDSQNNVLVGIGQWGDTTEIHGGGGNDVIFTYDNLNPWLGHVNASAFGDDGNDIVIGNEAPDHLEGGAGDDIIYGNGSDDVLVGGQGNDILDGGWGTDTADYSSDPAPITADMLFQTHTLNGWAGSVVDGWGTVDSVVDVERLIGTPGDDLFKAGQPDITFIGGAGSDTYVFRPWSGNMGIVDSTGLAHEDVNVLQLQGAFDPSIWSMTTQGEDAVMDFGTGHTVTLWGQHAGGAVAANIQRLEFQDAGIVVDLRS